MDAIPTREQDLVEFTEWYDLQAKEVRRNSEIVHAEDLELPFMLHVDKNTPKVFVPMMPWSAGNNENCTTARVCVCPTIVGCIIGYGRMESDYLSGPNQILRSDPFRGGYDICKLSFDHCLKVSGALAEDANRSDEHWLVGYKKGALQYRPENIGKLFIDKLETMPSGRKPPIRIFTGYLQHTQAGGLMFTKTQKIDPGFYRFRMELDDDGAHGNSVHDEEKYSITACDRKEYFERKLGSAALLSLNVPKFSEW